MGGGEILAQKLAGNLEVTTLLENDIKMDRKMRGFQVVDWTHQAQDIAQGLLCVR